MSILSVSRLLPPRARESEYKLVRENALMHALAALPRCCRRKNEGPVAINIKNGWLVCLIWHSQSNGLKVNERWRDKRQSSWITRTRPLFSRVPRAGPICLIEWWCDWDTWNLRLEIRKTGARVNKVQSYHSVWINLKYKPCWDTIVVGSMLVIIDNDRKCDLYNRHYL